MNNDTIHDSESVQDSPQKRYESALNALLSLIVRTSPYQMLAMLSITNLAAFDGVSKEHTQADVLTAMHIELLQALALRFKLSEYTINPPEINEFKELVQTVSLSFTIRGISESLEQSADSADLVAMRLHTQAIRNWAYPQETFEIAALLFAPFDKDFKATTGLSATVIITLLRDTIRWIEVQAKDALQGLRQVMAADSLEEVVQRYKEKFEKEFSSNEWVDIDALKNLIMADSCVSIFLLRTQFFAAMAKLHKLDAASVERLFVSLSHGFGELGDFNLDHLHLGNPVWTKPFVRDGDSYFLPVPSLLVSYCVEIMEKLLPKSRMEAYENHRYAVLEDKVAELFAGRFGDNNIYRGMIFDTEGHENDLLCLVDNYAFVIESKSGAIPPKAKLGLELTLAKTARKLIADSSEQAIRFADFIAKNRIQHKFRTVKNAVQNVDLSRIEHTVPMGALLSPLTQAYPGWQKLLRSNLVGNVPLVCCFLLTDLGYIFDVLDSDVALLHYLSRRERFEREFQYFGDEIDILNLYLDQGFSKSSAILTDITGYGQPNFDVYFMARGTKIQAEKPSLKRNNTWLEIIGQIDRDKPPGWLDLGCALLDVDVRIQDESDIKIQQLLQRLMLQNRLQADSSSCIYDDGDSHKFLMLVAHKPGANIEAEIERASGEITSQCKELLPLPGIIITASMESAEILVSAKLMTIASGLR